LVSCLNRTPPPTLGTLRVPSATSPSGGGKASDLSFDALHDRIEFISDLNVPEPNDHEPMALYEGRAPSLIAEVVRSVVDLNDDLW
jgi:hypothetical protein